MTLQLTRPLVQDCLAIAAALPLDEQRQYLATTGERDYDPQNAARALLTMPGLVHCAVAEDGQPLAIGGFQMLRLGVWQGWMVVRAEAWPTHGAALTRVARALQADQLSRADCHRIEVLSTRERTHAHQWYVDGLGMHLEGTRAHYFADGSDALVFTHFPQEA